MRFTAEEYYWAGVERMRQARAIHAAGKSYALAMYTGGLAVECVLRAFRWSKDIGFEGRHDLGDLLKASDILVLNEQRMRQKGIPQQQIEAYVFEFRAAMNEVIVLWHNNLRYASEASLMAFLNRIGRLQGVRGDAVKKNSSDLLNAAQTIVDRGVALWDSRKK